MFILKISSVLMQIVILKNAVRRFGAINNLLWRTTKIVQTKRKHQTFSNKHKIIHFLKSISLNTSFIWKDVLNSTGRFITFVTPCNKWCIRILLGNIYITQRWVTIPGFADWHLCKWAQFFADSTKSETVTRKDAIPWRRPWSAASECFMLTKQTAAPLFAKMSHGNNNYLSLLSCKVVLYPIYSIGLCVELFFWHTPTIDTFQDKNLEIYW